MGNNHDKTNNKQTGGTRATRKNIYKVAKNNKMNGGGFLDTFFGGVEKKPIDEDTPDDATPIPDATPVETPIITGTPVETPVIGETSDETPVIGETSDDEETPDANKKKEGSFFSSIVESAGQILDADKEEEQEQEQEQEPVKSPLDTNQILRSIAGLTAEIVTLQKMLLGETVEQPSSSVPMTMSDLDVSPEQVVDSSQGPLGMSDPDSTPEQEPVVESSQGPLGMSDLDSTPEPVVESSIGLGETDGEEEGEDGETLGQGDGLGSNQLDDTAGTMNIDELNTDSVESKEEGDAAPQPGGKKKAKKNTTRRKQLYQKK
jgi:hypothetical protein